MADHPTDPPTDEPYLRASHIASWPDPTMDWLVAKLGPEAAYRAEEAMREAMRRRGWPVPK